MQSITGRLRRAAVIRHCAQYICKSALLSALAFASCTPTGEFVLDFEEANLTEQMVRELIYDELVTHYHPN